MKQHENAMHIYWLAFLSFVSLYGSLSAQGATDAVWLKCLTSESLPSKNEPNPSEFCTRLSDNVTNCIEESIHKSKNPFDQLFVLNININNMNKALKYICSKYDIMNSQNFTCLSGLTGCLAPDVRNVHFNCFNGIIPCLYHTMAICSPKGAMIFSKALTMIKSTGCTLSSYQYNLKPLYGPEIHCYPELQKSANATARLGPNYEHFCREFKTANVSQCIEDDLRSKRSSFLLDDDYTTEAKEFFIQRSQLCDYFSQSTAKTCPLVDVLSCQKDLFKEEPFFVSLRNYSNCVYDKYRTCDTTLAKTIKYNLDGINGNSVQLSLSFVLILSQAAIILSLFF